MVKHVNNISTGQMPPLRGDDEMTVLVKNCMQNCKATFAEFDLLNQQIMYTLTELNVPIRSKLWKRLSMSINYADNKETEEKQYQIISEFISNQLRSIWDKIDEKPHQKDADAQLNLSLLSLHHLISSNSENLGK